MMETVKESYLGVVCGTCRQPIPLPSILVSGELAEDREETTRVFSLRCRACEKEKPYSSANIVEFEGTPRGRKRSYVAPVRPMKPLTKAATA